MRETEDQLLKNTLTSTATFLNCVGGNDADSPTEITRSDLDTLFQVLYGNSARRISDGIGGENKFGTAPVREAYWIMSHSNIIKDLEQVNGFIAAIQYPSQMNLLSAEYGSVSNFRFLTSPIGSFTPNASALGATVYNNLAIGQEAYACIDIEDANASFIYRPLGYGDDPLLLRQTCGWKFNFASVVTNDAWCANLRSTITS